MLLPKVVAVNEVTVAGEMFATVTLQVPIEDLEQLINHCDIEAVEESAGLHHALDSGAAIAKIREAEAAAHAASEPAPPAPPAKVEG